MAEPTGKVGIIIRCSPERRFVGRVWTGTGGTGTGGGTGGGPQTDEGTASARPDWPIKNPGPQCKG